MAALNRGIRIDSATVDIHLNNRLFEDQQGSLLLTARVEKPTGHSGTVEKVFLSPGADHLGYLEISIIYQDNGYRYKASSLGNVVAKGVVSATSNLLPYDQEVTLGVVYDAVNGGNGGLISLRTSEDNQSIGGTTGAAFGPITGATGNQLDVSWADSPSSIGLSGFKGFIGKLATYNAEIATANPNSLETYVNDPESWPATNLVHLLDGTQVRAQPGQDNSLPETQRIEFGPAGNSGFINVGGVQVFVRAGDSASTVADKIKTGLEADALYKPQAEKQQITVGDYTGAATSFKVDGVTVSLTGNTTKEALASAIASALQTNYSSGAKSGRFVNVHSDDSAAYVTITFAPTENNGNPAPLTIDSGTSTIPLSVDDVLAFSPSGLSRTVTKDGSNALLITFKPADADVNDFTITNGTTYSKIRINPGSTGVTVSASESKAATPSEFDFITKVLGEEQTISIIQTSGYTGLFSSAGGLGGGTFTISNTGTAGNATVTVPLTGLTTQTQIATAVRDALNASASSADSFVDDALLGADGKSVVVNFKPSAQNTAELTVATTDPVASASVQTTGEFARNARGEVQKVTFGAASTANSFTLDGVTITPASASQTAAQIAATAKKALEEKPGDAYSLAEVHSFHFKSGATTTGNLTIPSVTVATGVVSTAVTVQVTAGDSAASVANKVATALTTTPPAGLQSAVADGDTVHIKYTNAVRNPTNGFSIDQASLTATGVTYERKTDTRDFDVAGWRKITEDGNGGLIIEFNAAEGDVAPLIFNGTGSSVTASVATLRKAHTVDLTTSGYTGSVSTEGAEPSNVLYAQLVTTESGRDDLGALRTSKDVIFDIYLDPAYASQMGGGYESVSFTLNYPTVDVLSSFRPIVDLPDTTAGRGSSVYNVNQESGEITVSWIDTVSVTDFKKPIATVTLKQQAVSGAYNPSLNLSFTNVGIDNVDFTDGDTFTGSFSDSINTNRWDVSSRLVNALDTSNSIGIGGQRLLYVGEESSASAQLALTINHPDVDTFFDSLDPSDLGLTWGFAITTNQAATQSASFTLELPTQALNAGAGPVFTLSPAAVAAGFSLTQTVTGRTMTIEMETTQAGGLSVGSSLGLLELPVTNASDKSLEVSFAPGSVSINDQSAAGSAIYFGQTQSKVSSSTTDRGNWTAPDMPEGTFFKEFLPTAQTNAARVVTAADALQILKMSAGSNLDWLGSPTNASLVAADTDGNGKITAQDALVALRYSNGTIPTTGDPMQWTFIDGATTGLSLSNARPAASMNEEMPIDASVGTVRINADNNSSYWVKALLVGNLTSPTGAEYIS